jgi:hypothetical protein
MTFRRDMIDADRYRETGFALCKGFFAKMEIERIHREAKEIFTVQLLRLGIVQSSECSEREFEDGMFELFDRDPETLFNCGKQAQHLVSLHRLSLDDRIINALRELGLERPNICARPYLYFNHPRLASTEAYWRHGPHQDWRTTQGSLDSAVVWLPLTDIGRDLGALEIFPGSHLGGLLEADFSEGYGRVDEDIDSAAALPVEVERGDALFFSTFLLHRSGTNVTDSIRWSCHFRYNNLDEVTFIERGYPHPYIYKPQAELITEGFPARAQVERTFGTRATEKA